MALFDARKSAHAECALRPSFPTEFLEQSIGFLTLAVEADAPAVLNFAEVRAFLLERAIAVGLEVSAVLRSSGAASNSDVRVV